MKTPLRRGFYLGAVLVLDRNQTSWFKLKRKTVRHAMPTNCSIENCARPALTRGMCRSHYVRWSKHGDPLGGRHYPAISDELVWLERSLTEVLDECIEWPFRCSGGYGHVSRRVPGAPSASRVVCYMVYGAPPTRKHQAAHSCGKGHKGCVNWRHLSWKTPRENEADKLLHGTDRASVVARLRAERAARIPPLARMRAERLP